MSSPICSQAKRYFNLFSATLKNKAFMKELRDQLPSLSNIVYLNYGRAAPVLGSAIKKIQQLFEEAKDPFQFHRDEWFEHLGRAREVVAELIGASSDEIAFVSSTSSGLSLVASSIRWEKGDRVLFPADEYPSNRLVWENLLEKGIHTEAVKPVRGVPFSKQLEEMDLRRVRLIAVSAVSFWDGRRHDIERISQICQNHGILLSVDAVQAVGAIPVDVKTWGCDFLVSGGQKWLFSPIGTGFVYIKRAILPTLFVSQVGWANIQSLPDMFANEFLFVDGAKRFEPSYLDIPAFVGLSTAIETMKQIGWQKIYLRISSLVERMQKELTRLGLPPISPEPSSGIVAFDHPKAEEIYNRLIEHRVYTTQRKERLRVCLHAPVDDRDIDTFLELITSYIAKKL